MKIRFLALVFALASSCHIQAQTFTDSNLPIIIITTDGNATIPDEPKIGATMKIINRSDGSRNYVTDQNDPLKLNYSGRIGIEIRGSSTQFLEKKQYGFETRLADNVTNNNVSLLGMPKENDWILNGLGFEPSLIRDYISYNLYRAMGEYATRTRYCEVVINGDYRGLYVLEEKIKSDAGRVDIAKLENTDNDFPKITGGYITKSDKVAGKDVPSWTYSSYIGTNDVAFIHSEPKPGDITTQQDKYIRSVFDRFSAATFNNSISDGFPSVIDLPSFVNFMLINELSANVDAYQFSTYFHKDRMGKLRAGPLWDFNLTYGNDLFLWGLDRSKTNTWQFYNGDNIGARFWKDLFDNSTFKCHLAKRWNELTATDQPFNPDRLNTLIDTTFAKISEAAAREKTRWAYEWLYIWPSPVDFPKEISKLKDFITARMVWMTQNLGSFSGCSNVSTPPLVINKINYNPATSAQFPDSNDLEFIEITNNGNSEVDLTGIYFQGTGFIYQFPSNAKVPANGVLQIASKWETFIQRYGHAPFGEYNRHLANEGQKVILSDAYGNIVDEVDYSSTSPWPDANGNGKYLSLTDVNLDNNIASNWTTSDADLSVGYVTAIEKENALNIFPNPTSGNIQINSDKEIFKIQIHDVHGRMMQETFENGNSIPIDITQFSSGMYLLTIHTKSGISHVKILKK